MDQLISARDAAYAAKASLETEQMRALERGDTAAFEALVAMSDAATKVHVDAVAALEGARRAAGLSRPRLTAKVSFADACAARRIAKGSRS